MYRGTFYSAPVCAGAEGVKCKEWNGDALAGKERVEE
jgi:hypothetical protein